MDDQVTPDQTAPAQARPAGPGERPARGRPAASLLHRNAGGSAEPESLIFDVQGLRVFYGSFQAVSDATLPIREHEITALIGPSGCGKTTVLRCFNRMNDLIEGARVEGTIRYHGVDIYGDKVDPVEVRRRIGMVFQKPNPFPKSIYDNIAFGPRIAGYRGNMDDLVQESLTRAALWDEVKDKLRQPAYALSGGQQQRLCIARAIATSPDVLLMDEPCSALDPIATLRIEELMIELKTRLHHRHRHPQHAAGRPGERPHRLLHRGREGDRHAHRAPRRVRHHRGHLYQPPGEADRGLHHRPVRLVRTQSEAP